MTRRPFLPTARVVQRLYSDLISPIESRKYPVISGVEFGSQGPKEERCFSNSEHLCHAMPFVSHKPK